MTYSFLFWYKPLSTNSSLLIILENYMRYIWEKFKIYAKNKDYFKKTLPIVSQYLWKSLWIFYDENLLFSGKCEPYKLT
jgi:hypothetical protein